MTQEEKQLLLKDLCGRLPYGVMCHANEINLDGELMFINKVYNIVALYNDKDSGKFDTCPIADVKPYLRPMSSMTEGEKAELLTLLVGKDAIGYFQVENNGITNTDEKIQLGPSWQFHWLNFSNENISLYVNWLNARHFDYRGLIEKELALEAPEGMYV